jgi:hypothetical protein
MVIYMKHPVHGTKVACMEAEADADEKNGWTRFDPQQLELFLPEREPVDNALASGRPRRRAEAVQ